MKYADAAGAVESLLRKTGRFDFREESFKAHGDIKYRIHFNISRKKFVIHNNKTVYFVRLKSIFFFLVIRLRRINI